MATKVLVAGDVEGNLPALFKRVEAVNKKVNLSRKHFYLILSRATRISYEKKIEGNSQS
jgi:hypothetical protein